MNMIYNLLTLKDLRKYELIIKNADYNNLSVKEKHAIEKIALHYASFHHYYSVGVYDIYTTSSSTMERIPYEIFFSRPDDKVIEFLLSKNTYLGQGRFLELLKVFNVKSVDDIALVLALYRPGYDGYISKYLARRDGKEVIPTFDLKFDSILKDTYGIIIYHEQIMEIIKRYTGYENDKCEKLFWALKHKETNVIKMERKNFITALTKEKYYSHNLALKLFDLIEENATKTFWKSGAIENAIYFYTKAYIIYKIYNKEL